METAAERLKSRCLLVSLTITKIGESSVDSLVTRQVNTDYLHVDTSAGKYVRIKIPGKALEDHNKIISAARRRHREMTLSWVSNSRLLLSEFAMAYMRTMGGLKDIFDQATADLVKRWPEVVDECRNRLGRMFRPEDYPPAENLSQYFSMEVQMRPLDFHDDEQEVKRLYGLVDGIGDEIMQAVVESSRRDFERGLRTVVDDMKGRIRELFERISSVCLEDGRLYDSLNDAIVQCAMMAKSMCALVDDEELKRLAGMMASVANGFDIERLRGDKNAKLRYGLEIRELSDSVSIREAA